MKQIYIENQTKDQVYQNYRDSSSDSHRSNSGLHPNSDLPNIFLLLNKVKGPPGWMRSLGLACCFRPLDRPVAFFARQLEPIEANKIIVENELIKHINQNFYHN